MNPPSPVRALIGAILVLCAASARAQPGMDPASAQRGVEQSLGALEQRVQPAGVPDRSKPPAAQPEQEIALLLGVHVQTPDQFPKVATQIKSYWRPYLQQPVRGHQVNEFKSWLWSQLQRMGYFAYIRLQHQVSDAGTVLHIELSSPTIGRTTVLTLDRQEHHPLAQGVARRFAQAYPEGSLVDIQGIEAQLNAMSYALPISLEAHLRQVGTDKIDVVIGLRDMISTPGQITRGVVQFNNNGLKTYGREQALGVLHVAGPQALSEFVGVAQVSKGVSYLRGEYKQPIEGLASRWNVYGLAVRSRADIAQDRAMYTQRGQSDEVGGGMTTLLSTHRTGSWYSVVELSQRLSNSRLTAHSTNVTTTTRNRRDNQLRMGLKSRHKLTYATHLSSETTLTLGQLRIQADDTEFNTPEAHHVQGRYQRLEHHGVLQKALPADERWTFTTRWRAQTVSQNMDSYNKISLGGVNGIRAFDSDEGVGDQGLQVSFDLTRQINPNFYAGVFYDAGRVRTSKKPQSQSYSLQGAGVSMGGKLHPQVDWTLSVAKSHGSTPAQGITGQIGDWRAFFAANWRY